MMAKAETLSRRRALLALEQLQRHLAVEARVVNGVDQQIPPAPTHSMSE
jgi:hypothetical protein